MLEFYKSSLEALAARDRLRALIPRSGYDFSSNDYLGLAESPDLRLATEQALERGVPAGAGGSRLLRGNHPEHEALENEAARFFGAESALFFGGGFAANSALFSTLPQRGDLVIYDELIHASAHHGMRGGRAEIRKAAHNDAGAFEDVLKSWRAEGGVGRAWLAVESLYSMDGDRAPLAELMALAERYDAFLVIDEAHATGVYGPDGRGLGSAFEGRENVISLHTCGKALGAAGALICGPRVLRDFMVNWCRPFIYATAPSPLQAAIVRAALSICRAQPERRERLANLVNYANTELQKLDNSTRSSSGSHIIPVIIGEDARAVALAQALQAKGYDIRAIRPPTVPEGSSRLRIAITLNTNEEIVSQMLGDLAEDLRKL